jgi:F-type H+-transporting ATPase subunit b
VDLLAVAAGVGEAASALAAEEGGGGGLTINFFWVIVSALNFVLFFAIIAHFGFKPLTRMLEDRRVRIDQGLRDADQARLALESSAATAADEIAAARREARDIVERAQRVAQEARDADMAATREELERMRVRATAEIEAEKSRAIADLRAEVANLAIGAAERVVRESMDGPRQRRMVEEFLAETPSEARN